MKKRTWPKPPTKADTQKGSALDKFVIPKKWGEVADLMYSLKEEEARTSLSLAASPLAKDLAEIQRRRKVLEDHVIDNMSKSAGAIAGGNIGQVEVYTKAIPVVESQESNGWGKLYKHIQKTGEFFLLGKTLSTAAVNDIIDKGGKLPPGVTMFNQVKVSLTKTKKRK